MACSTSLDGLRVEAGNLSWPASRRIGKTRQKGLTFDALRAAKPARGILHPHGSLDGEFDYSKSFPDGDLDEYVEHFWSVGWRLGRSCRLVETLPHPNVQLLFEHNSAVPVRDEVANGQIAGVHSRLFTRTLTGEGRVFGVKFRAGAFHLFYQRPVSELRDSVRTASSVLPFSVGPIAALMAEGASFTDMVLSASNVLRTGTATIDRSLALARKLVETARDHSEICTVRSLAASHGITIRTLERLFSTYVGIGPKWVIRRYRLQDLIERAKAGERIDWAQLAVELGYADQAHLINDFRASAGVTPTAYRSSIRRVS